MRRNEFYHTRQKDVILSVIRNESQEFTIKDIYNHVKNETGLTTVYRLVDRLVLDGKVSKYIGKDNVTYYQYLEECSEDNHFYLKCDKCGNLIHIDCDCIEEMKEHMFKRHKFKLNKEHIIINGICCECFSRIK